jgi:hypothetical protein
MTGSQSAVELHRLSKKRMLRRHFQLVVGNVPVPFATDYIGIEAAHMLKKSWILLGSQPPPKTQQVLEKGVFPDAASLDSVDTSQVGQTLS